MNFITVAELNRDIVDNLYQIPRDIDAVVGVPRSGMLVAVLISLYLNKPLGDLDSFVHGTVYSHGRTKNMDVCVQKMEDVKKVLITEDSSNSGTALKEAKEKIRKFGKPIEYIWLAAYVMDETEHLVDISFRKIPYPRVFEWNFMHHWQLKNACVDIDGVLCLDPTPEENDDGVKYRNFIRTARPKYLPTREIGWLVTSRLEKYRQDTEYWLKNQGIKYNALCMMNLDSAEERRRLHNHAEFKADVFKKEKKATWFIESNPKQAYEIASLTGKEVFCVNNSKFEDASLMRRAWGGGRKRSYALQGKCCLSQ